MKKGEKSSTRKPPSPQAKRRKSLQEMLIDEAIGERIRKVRVDIADLDQKAFAERLGVSAAAVSQWELGYGCQRINLDKIVSEFQISRDWLHTGEGSPYVSRAVTEMRLLTDERVNRVIDFIRYQHSLQKAEEKAAKKRTARPPRPKGSDSNDKRGQPDQ
jgi:transcriptional regulator with XRE-family HTH domain